MKKIAKLLLIASAMMLIALSHCYAQESYYYYRGVQEPLSIAPSTVAIISLDETDISLTPLSVMRGSSIPIRDYKVTLVLSDGDSSQSPLQLTKELKSKFARNEKVIVLSSWTNAEGMILSQTLDINLKLKRESDITLLHQVAKEYHLQVVRQNPFMPLWYTVAITPTTEWTTVEVANMLFETGLFEAVSPDFLFDALECAYDSDFDKQWGLYNPTYAGIDLSICSAWNYATGRGIKIAIVDQGIDKTHIDLMANCSSISYDTETESSSSVVYGSHGTHCAGIAAAVRNNGTFIAGVAPDAQLISVSNRLSGAVESKLANGINWAWRNGADIISCSWWCTRSDMIEDAIDNAIKRGRNRKGCIFVKSAGNRYAAPTPGGSSISYPGDYRAEVLTVGAIGQNGERANFSSTGPALDVVAPGVAIYSTIPNGRMDYKSGTSMATPHVAGLAALILERNPQLSGQAVRDIIERTAKKVGSTPYNINKSNGTWNSHYGYGLVDAYRALQATPKRY